MASPTAIRSVAPTTASTHTTTVARGTHRLDVVGYGALLRHATPGESIASSPFPVGGYDWAIRFFPAGKDATTADYVGLVVELLSDAPPGARAWFAIDLEDEPLYYEDGEPVTPMLLGAGQTRWGYLQPARYVEARDDRVAIICTVEVLLPGSRSSTAATAAAGSFIAVPPPDMSDHLLRFLETKRGCDITFEVEDREFDAHRPVMAMRSPNFDQQSFGEDDDRRARIGYMKADVFEAVLRFIYTDGTPADVDRLLDCRRAGADHDKAALTEKVRALLVAADRFGLERLVRMCENALCAAMDAENAAATLRVADKHERWELKAFCIDYMASSPAVLKDVVATEAFQDLTESCPSLLADLLVKLALS
ncbi:hypothetical protein ACP70R_033591 [Stipagrostis hirtigluma subsp. patula]